MVTVIHVDSVQYNRVCDSERILTNMYRAASCCKSPHPCMAANEFAVAWSRMSSCCDTWVKADRGEGSVGGTDSGGYDIHTTYTTYVHTYDAPT